MQDADGNFFDDETGTPYCGACGCALDENGQCPAYPENEPSTTD